MLPEHPNRQHHRLVERFRLDVHRVPDTLMVGERDGTSSDGHENEVIRFAIYSPSKRSSSRSLRERRHGRAQRGFGKHHWNRPGGKVYWYQPFAIRTGTESVPLNALSRILQRSVRRTLARPNEPRQPPKLMVPAAEK
jgi:hypothetical protein